SIAFGETFQEGLWDTDDLTKLLQIVIENETAFTASDGSLSLAGRVLDWLQHSLRRNNRSGSKANIASHYDLSNDLFSLFLDPSMTYSSAVYQSEEQPLADAQRNKLRQLISKAGITEHDHVLEIGSGWGSFAIEAARETGCRVTTITLSEKQAREARERIRAAGLEQQISVLLCDYRDVTGAFDKIVSIEMLEAVGKEYFGEFFAACERLLKPNGVLVVQVITMPEQRYARYCRSSDFIQKYIFPGAHIPSLEALTAAAAKRSNFIVEDLENIGVHYARTLREWHETFIEKKDAVKELGFDDKFFRAWRYYFSYCEAGFATRILSNLQLVFTRPNNKRLPLTAQCS
ncbi:MAG: class I SAM-dependent methyltransferase, partial [Bdellovibrionales bacterium]|nr:class I SAM-dependent methyltransferase [Bdellovibrionales bacterium]